MGYWFKYLIFIYLADHNQNLAIRTTQTHLFLFTRLAIWEVHRIQVSLSMLRLNSKIIEKRSKTALFNKIPTSDHWHENLLAALEEPISLLPLHSDLLQSLLALCASATLITSTFIFFFFQFRYFCLLPSMLHSSLWVQHSDTSIIFSRNDGKPECSARLQITAYWIFMQNKLMRVCLKGGGVRRNQRRDL